ncbi:hypothetical protein [Lactiplantibacillus mudanjiangensis]|uniref:Uncharacterized protein n=1 Tax=Lactiplantibacillus mudanjiangensis TaxID=1296538 RepID=A0A660DX03_9LACO|nr:hypothetical protein [Lactiplantibacillus mudanjiangensis]VDG25307.1 hypothetical protein [Lactobacillus brevis ATCC 367] [Lactiplantibacillus mudanjiangensis]VDG27666.1 hypothetical protein [Lactobacillus brevis ATCC 367] [Lactiplantibacillus mudanjiangensis]
MRKLVLSSAVAVMLVGRSGFVMAPTIQAAKKSATVPTKFRHKWFERLENDRNPEFTKMTKHSIVMGHGSYHYTISGSNLSVKKAKGGWYRIGYTGNANPYYKVTKRNIGGEKVTVLLEKASATSSQANVMVTGKRTMTYNESFVNLK